VIFGKAGYLLLSGILLCAAAGTGLAQESSAQTTEKPAAPSPTLSSSDTKHTAKNEHRFWDKENAWLFAGVGASRALDYSSTLNLRRRGRQEILITNDVVDDHAGFAAVEAGGVGLSIGASYLFHRYGHHSLERWTSIIHIGLTTTGAVRNYCLKTAHH
jgi:hypothetical protein